MLEVKNLKFGYSEKKGLVLKDISFLLEEGQVLSLLGPNGTGKTTLLRCILGFLRPSAGTLFLDGNNLIRLSPAQRAKLVAYVPQSSRLTFPYTVLEVVLMGRIGHLGFGASPRQRDVDAALKALSEMNALPFADKLFQELSGGEKQLVLIARAIAQEAKLLILDEPTANLDFANENRTLLLVRSLAEKGHTVLMTTHSPDHAFITSEKAVLMKDGAVFAKGDVEEVLSSEILSSLYGLNIKVIETGIFYRQRQLKVCVPNMD